MNVSHKMTVALLVLALLGLVAASAFAAGEGTEETKLNVNSATVEELAKVPGLTPALAQDIVKYREEMGDIKSLDELLQVKGMDPGLLEKLKDYLSTDAVSGSKCTC